MPQKKNNTTLVTEDELMEAVTNRVTDNMKKESDLRFANFEKLFERLAQPPAPQPNSTRAEKRPAEETEEIDLDPPQPRCTRSAVQQVRETTQQLSDSFFPDSIASRQSASRTPAATITREAAGLAAPRP